jgi:hypothetical protein
LYLTRENGLAGRAFVDFSSKQDVAKALKYNNREIRWSRALSFSLTRSTRSTNNRQAVH